MVAATAEFFSMALQLPQVLVILTGNGLILTRWQIIRKGTREGPAAPQHWRLFQGGNYTRPSPPPFSSLHITLTSLLSFCRQRFTKSRKILKKVLKIFSKKPLQLLNYLMFETVCEV
jgi:hypothetical protein